MENRQRGKTIFRRSVVVLTALALISCCFVGSTLGRYVTKKSGTFDSGVALWKITETVTAGEGAVDVNLVKISPSKSPYSLNTKRSKELTNITVKIKNEGDVDAYVFLDFGTGLAAYGYNEDGSVSDTPIDFNVIDTDKNQNNPESEYYYAPWRSQLNEIFSLGTLEYALEDAEGNSEPATAESDGDYTDAYLVPAGKTLTVKTDITWKTDLTSDTGEFFTTVDRYGCVYADYRDTWIGENIGKISLAYSWYAVQGSEMPAETTPGN